MNRRVMRAAVGLAAAALALTSGVAAAAPAQAAAYDPTFVSAGYTFPVCFNGVLDNDSPVRSFNDPGGFESITFSLDGVALPGSPYAVPTGTEVTFNDVVPADTPVGNHTLTVDNLGFILATYNITLSEPCVAVSESDFGVNLYSTNITPDGTLSRDIELNSSSLASRQATVWVDDVLVWAPVVPANGLLTFTFTPPTCKAYTVKVSFGFPTLALDTVESPSGCPPPVVVNAVEDASTLESDVTVTNNGSETVQFVVLAISDSGADISRVPNPGSTSYTLLSGETVTFHAVVNPLPDGDTSYYFSLQPVLGDGEIGRSNTIMYIPGALLPVRESGPTVVGPVFRVGSIIKCPVSYTSIGGGVTPTYVWKRGAATIAGATKSSYTLTYIDYSKRMTCGSGASNAAGSIPVAYSAASAVVALGLAPKIVGAKVPKIIGTPTRGKYIGINQGVWTPKPTSYTCTLNRFVGSKIVRTLGPVKCTSATKFKVPGYPKGTKYFITVRAYKPGYAVGAKNTAVFKSR